LDAWNVTEDADLGLRLAIAGHRIADLPSATLEEAPQRLGAWMRQRRRWMKGFLQVS
jgi:cellulose synthase/poly-beta-1,6-N-acetylglucosamine synthase-like glycosyltransferase